MNTHRKKSTFRPKKFYGIPCTEDELSVIRSAITETKLMDAEWARRKLLKQLPLEDTKPGAENEKRTFTFYGIRYTKSEITQLRPVIEKSGETAADWIRRRLLDQDRHD